MTDGNLADHSLLPTCGGTPCAGPAFVVIDMGATVAAELVVVRGCSGGCSLEVSADGTAFQPAGAASEGFGAVALQAQPVRSVKVGLGAGLGGLREVSVWGPGPAAPGLRAVGAADQADLVQRFALPDDEGGLPLALVGVAVALLAASLVGTGFAAGRRGGRGWGPGRDRDHSADGQYPR